MTVEHDGTELAAAIEHVTNALAELNQIEHRSEVQLRDIINELATVREELKDFYERIEETIYRMNRDREGYDYDNG